MAATCPNVLACLGEYLVTNLPADQTVKTLLTHEGTRLMVNGLRGSTSIVINGDSVAMATSWYGEMRHPKSKLSSPIIRKFSLHEPDMLELMTRYLISHMGTPE